MIENVETADSADIKECFANWDNYDNKNFYESITPKSLFKFANGAGLNSGCDVAELKPYWEHANSALDVGAGYGRVIASLRKQGYKNKISAIERSYSLYSFLTNNVKNHASLFLADIHDWEPKNLRFDAIFFLWSGLADFSKNEQPLIIEKLANILNKDGFLLLDTMPMNIKPLNTEQFSEQSFLTKLNNNIVYTYEPTTAEVYHYASLANLKYEKLIHCMTDTKRTRWLYVLKKI